MRLFLLVPLLIVAASGVPGPARPGEGPTWPEAKCSRYRTDWTEALARRGATGLSPGFLAANAAFLASGCTMPGQVCPRSAAEIDLANVMTIRLMNFGTASTFLPFGCRAPAP